MLHELIPQTGIDSEHDRSLWIMQSTSERDRFLRAFPNPIPDTHEMACEWDETGMRLTFVCRPREVALVAGRAASLSRRLSEAVDRARKDLDQLKKEDLLARAAELGLGDQIPGAATKAQIIGQILKRMDEEGLLEQPGESNGE